MADADSLTRRVEVRRLEAGDYREWEALFRGYHDFYEATVADDVYPLAWSRLLSREAGTHDGFAAFDAEGAMIGIAHTLFHQSTWVKTGHVYMQDLFVKPASRGTGAGRALIEAVYAHADSLGAERTYWLTHESNTTARQLYDRVAKSSGFLQYRR